MNKKHYEDLLIELVLLMDKDVLSISNDNYYDNNIPAGKLEW